MLLFGDYHTHTPYSHGKNTVLENAEAARRAGLREIAITDHGFNHIFFGLKRKKLDELRRETDEAEAVTGVRVLMGMESNLISLDGGTDMRLGDYDKFDIYLCGIHLMVKYKGIGDVYKLMCKNYLTYKSGKKPSKSLIKDTTRAYVSLVKNNPVDILTHINYKCYCDVKEVAKVCADYGTYIEINTKKRHVSAEQLCEMADVGCRFVIDSDAHSAERVGDTLIADELIKESEIPLSLIDNIEGRRPRFRFGAYKSRGF